MNEDLKYQEYLSNGGVLPYEEYISAATLFSQIESVDEELKKKVNPTENGNPSLTTGTPPSQTELPTLPNPIPDSQFNVPLGSEQDLSSSSLGITAETPSTDLPSTATVSSGVENSNPPQSLISGIESELRGNNADFHMWRKAFDVIDANKANSENKAISLGDFQSTQNPFIRDINSTFQIGGMNLPMQESALDSKSEVNPTVEDPLFPTKKERKNYLPTLTEDNNSATTQIDLSKLIELGTDNEGNKYYRPINEPEAQLVYKDGQLQFPERVKIQNEKGEWIEQPPLIYGRDFKITPNGNLIDTTEFSDEDIARFDKSPKKLNLLEPYTFDTEISYDKGLDISGKSSYQSIEDFTNQLKQNPNYEQEFNEDGSPKMDGDSPVFKIKTQEGLNQANAEVQKINESIKKENQLNGLYEETPFGDEDKRYYDTKLKAELNEGARISKEVYDKQVSEFGKETVDKYGGLMTEAEISNERFNNLVNGYKSQGLNQQQAEQSASAQLDNDNQIKLNKSREIVNSIMNTAESVANGNERTTNRKYSDDTKFTESEKEVWQQISSWGSFSDFMDEMGYRMFGKPNENLDINASTTTLRKRIVDTYMGWEFNRLQENSRALMDLRGNQVALNKKLAAKKDDRESINQARQQFEPITNELKSIEAKAQTVSQRKINYDKGFDIDYKKQQDAIKEYEGYQNGKVADVVSVSLKNVANGVINFAGDVAGGLMIPFALNDRVATYVNAYDYTTKNPFNVINQGTVEKYKVYRDRDDNEYEERNGKVFNKDKEGNITYNEGLSYDQSKLKDFKKIDEGNDFSIAGTARLVSNQLPMMIGAELAAEKLAVSAVGKLGTFKYARNAVKVAEFFGKDSLIAKNLNLFKSVKDTASAVIWGEMVSKNNFVQGQNAGLTNKQAYWYGLFQDLGTMALLKVSPDSKYFEGYKGASKELFKLISANKWKEAGLIFNSGLKQIAKGVFPEEFQENFEQVYSDVTDVLTNHIVKENDSDKNKFDGFKAQTYIDTTRDTGILVGFISAGNVTLRGKNIGLNIDGMSKFQQYIVASQFPNVNEYLNEVKSNSWMGFSADQVDTAKAQIAKIKKYTDQIPPNSNLEINQTESVVLSMEKIDDYKKAQSNTEIEAVKAEYQSKIDIENENIARIFGEAKNKKNNESPNAETAQPTPQSETVQEQTTKTEQPQVATQSEQPTVTGEQNVPSELNATQDGQTTAEIQSTTAETQENVQPSNQAGQDTANQLPEMGQGIAKPENTTQEVAKEEINEDNIVLADDTLDLINSLTDEDGVGVENKPTISKEQQPTDVAKEEGSGVRGDVKWNNTGTEFKDNKFSKDGKTFSVKAGWNRFNRDLSISVLDENGKEVSVASFKQGEDGKFYSEGTGTTDGSFTEKDFRGKGLMKSVYDFVDKNYGEVKPSKNLTNDGLGFWESNRKQSIKETPTQEVKSNAKPTISKEQDKTDETAPSDNNGTDGSVGFTPNVIQQGGQENNPSSTIEPTTSQGTVEVKSFPTKNGKYTINKNGNSFELIDNKTGKPAKVSDKTKDGYFLEIAKSQEYPTTEIPQGVENEIDYNAIILSESKNPKEVANVLLTMPKYQNVDGSRDAFIANNINRVSRKSFLRFSDENNITIGLAKAYFAKSGEETNESNIDNIAKNASFQMSGGEDGTLITPQEVIDFILENRKGAQSYFKKLNPDFQSAVNKFVELTGVNPTLKNLNSLLGNTYNEEAELRAKQQAEKRYDEITNESRNKLANEYDEYFNSLTLEEQQLELQKTYPNETITNETEIQSKPSNTEGKGSANVANKVSESPEYKSLIEQRDSAEKEVASKKAKLDSVSKSTNQNFQADQENLFGDRAATDANALFDERANGNAGQEVIATAKIEYDQARAELTRINNAIRDFENGNASGTGAIDFQSTDKTFTPIPQSTYDKLVKRLLGVFKKFGGKVITDKKEFAEKLKGELNIDLSIFGTRANLSEVEQNNLVLALSDFKNGVDPKLIALTRSWFKGKDGKWKRVTETDLQITDNADFSIGEKSLGELVDFEELFKLYPDLRNLKVIIENEPERDYYAKYNSEDEVITINNSKRKDGEFMRRQLLHELQHHIQNIEGFAGGTNTLAEQLRILSLAGKTFSGESLTKEENELKQQLSKEYGENWAFDSLNEDKLKSFGDFTYSNNIGELESIVASTLDLSKDIRIRSDFAFSVLGEASNAQFMKTKDGEIYGAKFPDGTIYLNPEKVNANTPIHEFSHLWQQLMPTRFKKGVELLKNTPIGKKTFAELKANEGYANKSEEELWNEAMVTVMGNEGERIFNSSRTSKLKEWLTDLFKALGNAFGIRDLSPNDKLSTFVKGALSEVMGTKEIIPESSVEQKEVPIYIKKMTNADLRTMLDKLGLVMDTVCPN